MLIDTHAHLDLPAYNQDRAAVIRRAFSSGVGKIINIGCDLLSSQSSISLAEKNDHIYASIGIFPRDIPRDNFPQTLTQLYQLGQHRKVVAVGEIGLDYHQLNKESEKKWQIESFRQQLGLAKELNLPVILHCREAYREMLSILKADKVKSGVVHCFVENQEVARRFLDLGLLISFTGIITFTKGEIIARTVCQVPLEKILVETDCPYLAPVPYRGQRNEPAYVRQVAEKIATIKEVGLDQVERSTSNNAIKLFNLN